MTRHVTVFGTSRRDGAFVIIFIVGIIFFTNNGNDICVFMMVSELPAERLSRAKPDEQALLSIRSFGSHQPPVDFQDYQGLCVNGHSFWKLGHREESTPSFGGSVLRCSRGSFASPRTRYCPADCRNRVTVSAPRTSHPRRILHLSMRRPGQ